MQYDSDKHKRRSIRLKDYDYSQAGAYFVTICTRDRACVLGEISDGQVVLTELGEVVADSWRWLGQHYAHVELDQWVIMPNHLHGIILTTDNPYGGGSRPGSTTHGVRGPLVGAVREPPLPLIPVGPQTAPSPALRKPLGRLIGSFKTVSTKRMNELLASPGIPFWQRNYHEHVIRSEKSLNDIREYIAANPLHWGEDPENADGVPEHGGAL